MGKMENPNYLHTHYSSSDEELKNRKKDVYLFDCMCIAFKNRKNEGD